MPSSAFELFVQPAPADGWIAWEALAAAHPGEPGAATVAAVTDADRIIAWGMALGADETATAPVPDAHVRAQGYPHYPVVGHTSAPALGVAGSVGTTFAYGLRDLDAPAGARWLQGRLYLER